MCYYIRAYHKKHCNETAPAHQTKFLLFVFS